MSQHPNLAVWLKRLRDPNPSIRQQALRALEDIGGSETLVPLAHVFATDPEPSIRKLAQQVGKNVYRNLLVLEESSAGSSEAERQQAAEILAKVRQNRPKR